MGSGSGATRMNALESCGHSGCTETTLDPIVDALSFWGVIGSDLTITLHVTWRSPRDYRLWLR